MLFRSVSHGESVTKAGSEAAPVPSVTGTPVKHFLQKDRHVIDAINVTEAVPAPSMRGTAAKHILQKDRAVLEALNEETAKDTSAGVNLAQTRATIIPGRRRVHGGGADWTFPLVAGIAALAVAYSTVSQTPGGSAALALFEGQCMSSKAD